MVNPHRGEIAAKLDGKDWTLCLTLGALASLEHALDAENLHELTQKFSSGKMSARDILQIIHAGLCGGGYTLTLEEVSEMRVENGVSGYVEIAAKLLEATFSTHANQAGHER